MKRRIHKVYTSLILILILIFSTGSANEVYKWVDENGTIHFTDSAENIPPKYRKQLMSKQKNEDRSPDNSKPEIGKLPELIQDIQDNKQNHLNSFQIPYLPNEGAAKRIIISVILNDSLTVPMAIDTGSPGMIISPQVAEKIGVFDKEEGNLISTASGIGGSVPVIRTIIDKVQVGEAKNRFNPVTVTPLNSASFDGLIGMDFMSGYLTKIDPQKNVILFEEILPDSEHPGGRTEQWWRNLFKEFSSARLEWKEKARSLDKYLKDKPLVIGGNFNTETIKRLKAFADKQYQEADKLLDKLDRYANENFVPRNWR